MMAKNGLRAAGLGGPAGPFSDLVDKFQKRDTWIAGAFALEQGFIFTAMVLSAAVVGVIERRWNTAAAWCVVAARSCPRPGSCTPTSGPSPIPR